MSNEILPVHLKNMLPKGGSQHIIDILVYIATGDPFVMFMGFHLME